MLDGIRESVRQWLYYPKDFRIDSPKWPNFSESLEGITNLLQSFSSRVKIDKEEELLDMAVDVGTLVWRIQQRLSAKGELPRYLQRVSRDLDSTWDALAQRGIEIKDHTGQDYDAGMALRVITSQQVAGLTRQQIIETLKPTIYHRDKIIQMGEVIVGVPEETEVSKQAQETT